MYETSVTDRVCFGKRDQNLDTARRRGNEPVSACARPGLKCELPLRWAALTAALFSICLSSASQTQSVTTSHPKGELPTLTTAREAHSLSSEEAKRSYPVHLRGVITFFDPDYGTGLAAIFIHDDTGSVFVSQTSKLAASLFAGALVDVHGVTKLGGFGSIVDKPQIRILGRAPLPPNPPRVSLALLKTGAYDAQWVEVEGSVHRVTEYPHAVVLNLELSDGPLPVLIIKEPGATYSNLVNAQVRIHANAAPTMNSDGQMIGVHLQGPNLSALQVVEPAPSDPFASPPIPIQGLLQWEHFSTPMHRVHLRGNVTLQWPGSMLCIRDATRGICAQTTQATPVAEGDLVDLAGFVETESNVPVVTDAVFQIAGTNSPVAPRPATADKILDGGFSSRTDPDRRPADRLRSDLFRRHPSDLLRRRPLPRESAQEPRGLRSQRMEDREQAARHRHLLGPYRRYTEQCACRRGRDQVLPCPHALSGRRHHSGTSLLVDAVPCPDRARSGAHRHALRPGLGRHPQKAHREAGRASPRERGNIPPYGFARCLDRTGNPGAAARPAECRIGWRQAAAHWAGGPHGGSGQVQGDQRYLWPPGR